MSCQLLKLSLDIDKGDFLDHLVQTLLLHAII